MRAAPSAAASGSPSAAAAGAPAVGTATALSAALLAACLCLLLRRRQQLKRKPSAEAAGGRGAGEAVPAAPGTQCRTGVLAPPTGAAAAEEPHMVSPFAAAAAAAGFDSEEEEAEERPLQPRRECDSREAVSAAELAARQERRGACWPRQRRSPSGAAAAVAAAAVEFSSGGSSAGIAPATPTSPALPALPPGGGGGAHLGCADLSRSSTGSSSGSAASGPLPELLQHVRQQQQQEMAQAAGASYPPGSGGRAPLPAPTANGAQPPPPLLPEQLPAQLQAWLVDPADVEYLQHPDGQLQELGRGASARVIRAELRGEAVAAKEFRLGRGEAHRRAFLTEAARLAELRHPHVVGLAGACLAGDRGVLLLEHCAGCDLFRALELPSASAPGQRLFGWHRRGRRVAYEVARALAWMHSRGVAHMDVKSSNILLTSSGTAKLCDLALSLALAAPAEGAPLGAGAGTLPDVSGDATGTWAWAAPEVLASGVGCSLAADIHSFGVVLHEIITGERPERGCLRAPLPEECPQDIHALMLECLSEDPAQRPTAEQLVRRLRPRRPAGSQHGSSVSLAGLGSLALGEEEEQGRQRSA